MLCFPLVVDDRSNVSFLSGLSFRCISERFVRLSNSDTEMRALFRKTFFLPVEYLHGKPLSSSLPELFLKGQIFCGPAVSAETERISVGSSYTTRFARTYVLKAIGTLLVFYK